MTNVLLTCFVYDLMITLRQMSSTQGKLKTIDVLFDTVVTNKTNFTAISWKNLSLVSPLRNHVTSLFILSVLKRGHAICKLPIRVAPCC